MEKTNSPVFYNPINQRRQKEIQPLVKRGWQRMGDSADEVIKIAGDTEALAKGIYFLRIKAGEEVVNKNLVKM